VMRWCDPAFTLAYEEPPLPEGWKEGGTIGLNVSPLILKCAKDGSRALDAFVSLVRHILATSDHAVALIPHVTWAHDNDMDALSTIKAQFADEPRVFLLDHNLTSEQIKGYIRRLSALVTARTHASIAGYSSCVPTLVIGYSIKARGIARDLFGDEQSHLIPVQELSGDRELIGAYDAMMLRADSERAFLKERLPAYTAGREAAIGAVMALAKRRRKNDEPDGQTGEIGMHRLRRMREHLPRSGNLHEDGRGGLPVSVCRRRQVHRLRSVREALPGRKAFGGAQAADLRRAS